MAKIQSRLLCLFRWNNLCMCYVCLWTRDRFLSSGKYHVDMSVNIPTMDLSCWEYTRAPGNTCFRSLYTAKACFFVI